MIKHNFTISILKSHPKLRFLMKILRFWFYLYTHFKIFFRSIFCLERKWLIIILREVLILWLYWRMFPFHYFRYKFYLENNKNIEDLKKYIPEFYFDNIIIPEYNDWTNRLLMSNKVFVSKFLNKFDIPSSKVIIYSENGYLFDSDNNILTSENSVEFILQKISSNRLFLKPAYGSSGNGILLFKNNNGNYYNDLNILNFKILKAFSKRYDFLLEDEIKQYDVLERYNPDSINTLRVITLLMKDKIYPLKVVLRMGRRGTYVDNSAQGGISCEVDIEDWKLKGVGASEYPVARYDKHPDSLIPFNQVLDFKKETLDLVEKNGLLFPSCRILGWDIVLTPKGPSVLEINPGFGIDHMQLSCNQGISELLLDITNDNKQFIK